MTPETASHEVNPADLQVPGGATDELWYLAAYHLAPHMESTRKRGWVEGFVAALELIRGVNVAETEVTRVLRDTIILPTMQEENAPIR